VHTDSCLLVMKLFSKCPFGWPKRQVQDNTVALMERASDVYGTSSRLCLEAALGTGDASGLL
jgi:hypothetical protein